jgi:calcineurin-like phosphoesterase family protein
MYWFTADTHFNHANVIKYCQRPFASVDEMNQALIDNINERVQPGDTLYHLGDFSFGRRDRKTNDAAKYLERIRCKNVMIIPGNHDPHHANGLPRKEFAQLFAGCYPFFRLKAELAGVRAEIFMFHYACRVWMKSHHGTWHLYGHSHGTLEDLPNSMSLDIGVDSHNYRPLNIADIAALMAKKTFTPIDHHGDQGGLDLKGALAKIRDYDPDDSDPLYRNAVRQFANEGMGEG